MESRCYVVGKRQFNTMWVILRLSIGALLLYRLHGRVPMRGVGPNQGMTAFPFEGVQACYTV
jgi:hypothetical protein